MRRRRWKHGGGGAAGGLENVHGLLEKFLVVTQVAIGRVGRFFLGVRVAVDFALHGLRILRRAVFLQKFNELGDFVVGNKGALCANEAGRAGRREEHVAATDESVGALGVDDGARVHLRGDLKGDARGDWP